MKNRKLLVIILMWNDFKNTYKAIESCKKNYSKNIYFLLVDNNSNDGSYQKICDQFKFKKIKNIFYKKIKNKFLTIKNKKNLGCGYGHNVGYKFGIKNNFDYIARIDNDMTFGKNFFKKNLIILDKNPSIVGLSPKIMYQNFKNEIWWKGCKIGNSLKKQTIMKDYPYHLKDNKNFKGLITTDAIAGCASFVKSSILKKSGLNDKDFFYGPEDIEFSHRIKKFGNIMVNLDSKIFHKITQSFRELNERKTYFEHKYRLLLIKKIGSIADKFFGYSISFIKYALYCIFFFKKHHRKKIAPVGKALLDFFIFQRLGEYDRKFNSH